MATETPTSDQTSLQILKQNLIDYVRFNLGDQMIDIELDPEHYETAYQRTIGVYRQRANNAYEESYSFFQLIQDVDIYTLTQEVISVRQLFRRTFGLATGPFASNFDPFSQAQMQVYLLNFNQSGGLATYDFYTGYVELAARMFGGYLNYTFNPVTKKLQIIRDPKGTGEDVLIWSYNLKPEFNLLSDYQISQWIRDYMLASCKMMLGEAREKFAQYAGPQGGSALNGTTLKTEAQAAMDKCIEDLKMYVDASQPLTWVIG